ncbi:cation diffusion facilitator family transporter [Bacillus sp. CGMCC 1.16607]|uniref:cation diffusion facilitator family transporter n=1 Tax=Bacillus sp. CGMCC 1.16607 TaxID=3351842 RepID=UPI003635B6DE
MAEKDRFKKAENAAMIGIVGNIILAAIKWIIGIYANSKALVADAVHSASDVAGSLAVYIGLRAAKQPPDEDHPYGHGKAELIAAIIVGVLLMVVGFEIGKASFTSFFKPLEPPKMMAIVAVLISIIIKEWMFRYKFKLGKELNSEALIANAYEHRSDVYSSIAALIGIGAAILGGKLHIDWLIYADPVAGLLVSILVIKMAWQIGKEAIHNTMDHVLHGEETQHMNEIALKVEGVIRIDELYAREHGHYVIIDIKISVDPYITVENGHLIGKSVKANLLELPNVQNVMVHVNPYNEVDQM